MDFGLFIDILQLILELVALLPEVTAQQQAKYECNERGINGQPFVAPVLLNVHDTITRSEDFQDYKSQLQELVQKMFGVVPRYETTGSEGPDHDKIFYVSVTIDGRVIGQGKGRRVKSAENRAAKAALGTLQPE